MSDKKSFSHDRKDKKSFSQRDKRHAKPYIKRDEEYNKFENAEAEENDFIENTMAPPPRLREDMDALMDLDKELLKVLVRRSRLLSKIRGGREHASTPRAIQAEKTVRQAWEKAAPQFSRDSRLAREFFSLLQDISFLSRDSAPKDSFKLFPSQSPVTGTIIGPLSGEAAQIWLAIAIRSGEALNLKNVSMTNELSDCVKTFTQLGAKINWEPLGPCLGNLILEAGADCDFLNKTTYVGDSIYQVYFTAFLAAASTGTCRLAGGSVLKNADLTPLRQILPLLGARLAHVVPHSQGLPARLESSGDLPTGLTVPENLPLEAICALMAAGIVWNKPIAFNLEKLPASVATSALARVEPIGRMVGAEIDARGAMFRYTPSEISVPEEVKLPLDPDLAAYFLAIPAFVGGEIRLQGVWPDNMPEAQVAKSLLTWAGLEFEEGKDFVGTKSQKDFKNKPLGILSLSSKISPLYFSLAALKTFRAQKLDYSTGMGFEGDDDLVFGTEMLGRLGIEVKKGYYQIQADQDLRDDFLVPWTSPDGFWGIGYALSSFFRQGLRLGNPSDVTSVLPMFWMVFNSLPELNIGIFAAKEAKTEEKEEEDVKKRRRIIAD